MSEPILPISHLSILFQLCERVAADGSEASGGNPFCSDWHNALKLGFDVRTLEYPKWILSGALGEVAAGRLPRAVRPGAHLGNISAAASDRWGLPKRCVVTGGSTDSISAFLASGASEVGDAVTSLGSTLALKMLSATPVDDDTRGVYSHRLGDLWLAGGASNVGCAVLREQGFDAAELVECSARIDGLAPPPQPGYYPLPAATTGERFPVADDRKAPMLSPVPEDRAEFLHSILHAIAAVEAEGYAALKQLGASPLRRVFTAGGGAANDEWTRMREAMLGVEASRADNTDAAYGVALLAARGDN